MCEVVAAIVAFCDMRGRLPGERLAAVAAAEILRARGRPCHGDIARRGQLQARDGTVSAILPGLQRPGVEETDNVLLVGCPTFERYSYTHGPGDRTAGPPSMVTIEREGANREPQIRHVVAVRPRTTGSRRG